MKKCAKALCYYIKLIVMRNKIDDFLSKNILQKLQKVEIPMSIKISKDFGF